MTQAEEEAPHCVHHPRVLLRCPACAGVRGGRSKSLAKLQAVRRNAKKALRARLAKCKERKERTCKSAT